MKQIIYNSDLLKEEEIKRKEIRVKALVINSKDEMLVGFSHNTYQFIGGHIENDEDMIEGLKREIKEESGIEIDNEQIIPFFIRKKYYRNYPEINSNSCYEYYYYVINTDKIPNLNCVNYTDAEKEGKFELRYIPLNSIENEFENNKSVSEKTAIVEEENLEAIAIYKDFINK